MNFNRIRRRVWLTTHWGQYYIAAFCTTGPLAALMTENSDYGTEAWTTGDIFVITWILGGIGIIAAIGNLISEKKYIAKLDEYSHLSQELIEAKPDETTGKLNVYVKTYHINGENSTLLRQFHPEDELEECLDFVNQRRAVVENKKIELTAAERVAKLINEGK